MGWYLNRKLSDFIEHWPGLYLSVQKWRYRKMTGRLKRIVSPDTEIMIEGYPRCANSFSVKAFRFSEAFSNKMKIATHLHSPAHVILSVRMHVPTLVLIRHPDGAVVSKLAKFVQFNELPTLQKGRAISKKEKRRLTRYWTLRYANFYKALVPYVDNIVVGEFQEATSDFSGIMKSINTKFNKSFRVFTHSSANEQKIFSSAKPHLYPSRERDRIKSLFEAEYLSPENSICREKAIDAYQRFVKLAGCCQ